jgi:3-phosphoshikimate 1-carboxyvinyltransferase
VGELETVISAFGGQLKTTNGYPPVIISESIKSGTVTINQPLSSQGISGLLMALPLLKGDSRLEIIQPVSLPYIQLTLKFLSLAGIEIQTDENFTFFSIKGEQRINPLNVSIEGDWSSASTLITAAAIYGDIKIENLTIESFQPDKKIIDLLPLHSGNTFHIKSSNALNGIEADITHCPDLFPALVLWASHSKSGCNITGIHRLEHKESNRLETFMKEFSKFGTEFNLEQDSLHINPGAIFNAAVIESHHDHRIAMAAALAVTGTQKKVIIQNAECVSKSYPSFWEDIKCLGAKVIKN